MRLPANWSTACGRMALSETTSPLPRFVREAGGPSSIRVDAPDRGPTRTKGATDE